MYPALGEPHYWPHKKANISVRWYGIDLRAMRAPRVVALCNQIAGRRLGFLNSALYHISRDGLYAKTFHDIIIGNNAFTFHSEKGNVQTIPGFDAGRGWDPTTGLGTPKAARLSTILALAGNTVDDEVDAS